MGLSGMSFGELLLILIVLLLLFGSRKLPGIASDLGTALRDLRRSLASDREQTEERPRDERAPPPPGRGDA